MSFTRSATSNFLRITVVAGVVSGLGGLFAGILFLSALSLHSHVLGVAALFALASSLLGISVTQGWRTHLLFNTGSWTTLDGRPTSRREQPARFVTWVTLHSLLAATSGTVAVFVIWIAISSDH